MFPAISFSFPLTMHLGIGNFIQTYSLSQKTLLADDTVDFGFSDDITINEPEGLCETNPGEFIAIVNVTKADGGRYVQFYRTRVPYLFTVSTSAAEHGSVSEGGEVSRGEEKPFPTRQTKASGSRNSRWTACICR